MKLHKLVEEFFTVAREAVTSDDTKQLHKLRIAAKRLRYTIEILRDDGEERLEQLKAVQQVLGEMQDATVGAEFLRGLPELTEQAAALPALLEAEAQDRIRQFRAYWREQFDSVEVTAEWIRWARGGS